MRILLKFADSLNFKRVGNCFREKPKKPHVTTQPRLNKFGHCVPGLVVAEKTKEDKNHTRG